MPSETGTETLARSHVDVHIRDLLIKQPPKPSLLPNGDQPPLPEPIFPRRPELLADEPADFKRPAKRHWDAPYIWRAVRGWLVPYIRSRVLPGDYHPLIACFFTEWKCNLDCHYCWAFDNRVQGMTEEVARRSIDWLHADGCRVLALMGGEPLLRPQFVHKVVDYAARKGFWVYVPTNGRLLRPEWTDRLGDAGVATFNFAVDCVNELPGLPKALTPVRPYFEYLVKKQYRYGYTVFFNINICRSNHDDVRQLTEIAHDYGIAVDYHINEPPMIEQPHFRHFDGNGTYLRPRDFARVDELIDWIIDRNRAGYKMVNSIPRLQDMKEFMRGKIQEWNCRAGHNSMIIRVDGTLAPCFPMYSATCDWGTVGNRKFEAAQLNEMKKSCQQHCFSTLNHNLGYCYEDMRVIRWMLKQAARGFQGVSGSFS